MAEAVVSPAPLRQTENTKLGMWLFLGGEVVFFTTLILTFVFLRLKAPQEYTTFKGLLSIPLIGGNTLVLIASSYMVVRALEAIRGGSRTGLRNNLLGVLLLGALFLTGQAYEWVTLFGHGVSVKDLFGSAFFTVTGFHGTHVFVGLVWLGYLLLGFRRGAYTASQHRGVEIFGLYWHFVDMVWIVLFTIIYLV